MRKLNKTKVRWIVREMEKGLLSPSIIAEKQSVSVRWVKAIYRKYHGKNLYDPSTIVFNRPGRKPRPITNEERDIVRRIHREMPMGALNIEKILRDSKRDAELSHNRIHQIMLELHLSNTEEKKSRQRKWVRYEREHTNSLWHTDWFEHDGEHFIVFEDDASRFITGFGVFNNATSENAALVLHKAVTEWGKPVQLISDHGTQFVSIERDSCPNPAPNVFQRTVQELGIEHIKARVKHPQTNGKVERVGQSLKRYFRHFKTWEKTIEFYNFKRPHMSLELDDRLRTPYQAFMEKQIKE
jgi:transposase InsO family protein